MTDRPSQPSLPFWRSRIGAALIVFMGVAGSCSFMSIESFVIIIVAPSPYGPSLVTNS